MNTPLSWRVGDVKITKIVEIESTGSTKFILPQATREAALEIGWLAPHFMNEEGRLKMSIHALVIETPSRRMIVDTCLGNDKQGRGVPWWNGLSGPFLGDLAAAGFSRESIDTVMCTHLHVDHVGWNTMLVDGQWVPTFPRARYLMGRVEFEHWRDQQANPEQRAVFGDSVQPVFDAGLVDLVEIDHKISPEVSFVPTLGHTPGHVSIRISSKGEEALITGDFIHHPSQMAHPEWASSADYDQTASTKTRREVFARLAEGSAAGLTVVTPNRRLALALKRAFDELQAARGLAAWDAADILPITAFVERAYEDAVYSELAPELPVLATPVQEQALWENVIRDSGAGESLLAVPEAARLARRRRVIFPPIPYRTRRNRSAHSRARVRLARGGPHPSARAGSPRQPARR